MALAAKKIGAFLADGLDASALRFLKEYLSHFSPTGREYDGQKAWFHYLEPFVDECVVDCYENVIGIVNPAAKFKVVLEAHADEISWLVNYIDKDGFIHVLMNGGADAEVAPGKRVTIRTENGAVPGVFGWPAVHVRKDSEKLMLRQKYLFVDCGCASRSEAESLGIQVGDTITFDEDFSILNDRYFTGRGMDNRIGGFILSQVARQLRERRTILPYGLYIVNAVQEEVGSRGAQMIAQQIRPQVAIITDASHDTNTPFIEKRLHGDTACGRGPILAIAPSVHKDFLALIRRTAERNHIPYQLVAVSRETGTDADAIALAEGGVISALISTPLRYMHTPVELVSRSDVENVIRLIGDTLTSFDAGTFERFKEKKYPKRTGHAELEKRSGL